jgi:glucose/arabinose dehydrogenase
MRGTVRGGDELVAEQGGNTVQPATVQPTKTLIEQLKVPRGFKVSVFALNLGQPRMMAVGDGGVIYVTRREPGDVVGMWDLDADGIAERVEPVVQNLPGAHGIAVRKGRMYIATVREVYVANVRKDGTVGPVRKLIENLPEGGRHPNRTLVFGPDEMLYVSVGSTCNCCMEANPESATILRVDPETGDRGIWARGLRNTLGFGWHPKTEVCWGMDHGSDWLGDQFPPEELNKLDKGKDYGWPLLHGKNEYSERIKVPPGEDIEQWKSRCTPMTLGYTAHAAPLQMAYYTGRKFPAEYRNDAFVAMHGSWNAKPAVRYEVVRIRFDKDNGAPVAIEPFISGWLLGENQQFGRPCGIAVAGDGSLIVGDDTNGVIYRVGYAGEKGK